jgi:hypothetical protein
MCGKTVQVCPVRSAPLDSAPLCCIHLIYLNSVALSRFYSIQTGMLLGASKFHPQKSFPLTPALPVPVCIPLWAELVLIPLLQGHGHCREPIPLLEELQEHGLAYPFVRRFGLI